jgi:hypothetical protein
MPRPQVDLRFEFDGLSRHKLQVESARKGGDMGAHLHQGEMFADTGSRAKAERQIDESVAAGAFL